MRATLTSDVVLDVLESIGYTGIPQKETLTGVQPIIQEDTVKSFLMVLSLCVHAVYSVLRTFIKHLDIYIYDLLLKPRNVHVDFTGIIHCNSFLIDQFV